MSSKQNPEKVAAFCSYPFAKIKIESNGMVHNCAWMKPGAIGNILEQSLEDIFNGSRSQKIRLAIEKGKLAPACRSGHCPFKYQERVAKPVSLSEFPSVVELDLPNTHCNIGGEDPTTGQPACIMCPRSALKFKPDVDRCDEISDRLQPYMPYFKKLHLQGIAEPFWKDRAFQILERLRIQDYPSINVSTITNGTIFSERVRNRWRELCPGSLTMVSVDAASPEVYKKIRRIDGFERVVENVRDFCREKDETQICGIVNNINIYNVAEVGGMVEMAAEVGCNYLSLNATDDVDKSMSHFVVNQSNAHLFDEAEKLAKERAHQLGVSLIFVKPLNKGFSHS